MGRMFTKSWANRLQDDQFCARYGHLDKLLWLTLNQHTECDNAGLGRITARRWASVLAPASEADVWAALARLEDGREVFADPATEEFLVRTFMFDDEIGRKPNILINAARSCAQVRSPKLAAVLLDELARVDVHRPEDPKVRARLDTALLAAEEHLTARAALYRPADPEPFPEPFPEGFDADPDPPAQTPDPEPFHEPIPEPSFVVAVEVAPSPTNTTQIERPTHLTQPSHLPDGERPRQSASAAQDRGPDRSPPPHTPGPDCASTPCGPCADTARAAITVRAERTADASACSLCDHHGHRIEPPELAHLGLPVIRCDHTPMSLDDWARHTPAPVQVRPQDWPTRRRTPTTRRTRNARHAAHDHVPGHRDHGAAPAA